MNEEGNQQRSKVLSSRAGRGYDRVRKQDFENVRKYLFSKQSRSSFLQILQPPEELCLEAHKYARIDTSSTLVNDENLTEVDTPDKLSVRHESSLLTWTFVEVVDGDQLKAVLRHNKKRSMIRLHQEHSFARLSITEALYNDLCAELQIFDALRDVLMHMGVREREVEIAPLRMRWQMLEDSNNCEADRGWECAYCLRYIRPNNRSSSRPWSLRQFTVYNKVQTSNDRSTWLFVSAPEDVIRGIESIPLEEELGIRLTDVETHCSISMTTSAFWRSYVVYLSEAVDEYNDKVKFANPAGCKILDVAQEGMLLQLKNIDDDVVDAVLALEANIDQMKSLLTMWRRCRVHDGAEGDSQFATATIYEVILDIEAILRQLHSLRSKLATCTFLASHFTELGNGIALKENGEDLRKLAHQGHIENERTRVMTIRAAEDTVAVKGLTVIAAVFLPTTVVLNFFSTSLINSSHGNFVLDGKWWIFLVVAAPLTIVTLLGWYIWVKSQSEAPADVEAGLIK